MALNQRTASPWWASLVFGLGLVHGMVGAGLFDGFGLGLLDEGGVGEAALQALGLLGRNFQRLGQAGLFGGNIDHAFQRNDHIGIAGTNLHGGASRGRFKADAV